MATHVCLWALRHFLDLQERVTWDFPLSLPLLMKISGSICSSSMISASAQTNSKCKTGKDESEKDNQTVVKLEKS